MPGAGLLHPLEQRFLAEHTQLGLQLEILAAQGGADLTSPQGCEGGVARAGVALGMGSWGAAGAARFCMNALHPGPSREDAWTAPKAQGIAVKCCPAEVGGASLSISCFSRESQAPGRRALKLCHSDQDVLIVEVVMGVEGVEVVLVLVGHPTNQ